MPPDNYESTIHTEPDQGLTQKETKRKHGTNARLCLAALVVALSLTAGGYADRYRLKQFVKGSILSVAGQDTDRLALAYSLDPDRLEPDQYLPALLDLARLALDPDWKGAGRLSQPAVPQVTDQEKPTISPETISGPQSLEEADSFLELFDTNQIQTETVTGEHGEKWTIYKLPPEIHQNPYVNALCGIYASSRYHENLPEGVLAIRFQPPPNAAYYLTTQPGDEFLYPSFQTNSTPDFTLAIYILPDRPGQKNRLPGSLPPGARDEVIAPSGSNPLVLCVAPDNSLQIVKARDDKAQAGCIANSQTYFSFTGPAGDISIPPDLVAIAIGDVHNQYYNYPHFAEQGPIILGIHPIVTIRTVTSNGKPMTDFLTFAPGIPYYANLDEWLIRTLSSGGYPDGDLPPGATIDIAAGEQRDDRGRFQGSLLGPNTTHPPIPNGISTDPPRRDRIFLSMYSPQ